MGGPMGGPMGGQEGSRRRCGTPESQMAGKASRRRKGVYCRLAPRRPEAASPNLVNRGFQAPGRAASRLEFGSPRIQTPSPLIVGPINFRMVKSIPKASDIYHTVLTISVKQVFLSKYSDEYIMIQIKDQ